MAAPAIPVRAGKRFPPHLKLAWLVSLGGGIEIFEFFSYAIFANRIAAAFYPSEDQLTGTLLTLSSLAVGFLARPFGAAIMSHFGDRYGRRPVFVAGLAAMSLATAAIGLLPTYAQWGAASGVIVVLLRVVQGLSVGGEMPGAAAYMVETVPRRASLLTGLVSALASIGVLAATGLSWVIESTLSEPDLTRFGWRIPFLIAGGCGFMALLARRGLVETPAFTEVDRPKAKVPLGRVWRSYRAAFVVGLGVTIASMGFQGVFLGYLPIYLTRTLHYAPLEVARALNAGSLVGAAAILGAAALGQVVRPYWLMRLGAAALVLLAYPFFLAAAGRAAPLSVLFAGGGLVQGLLVGTFAFLSADLFPVDVRYSGSGVSQTLANALAAGLAPLAAAWLVAVTGQVSAPAAYLMLVGGVGLAASLFLPRHLGHIARDAERLEARPTVVAETPR